MITVTVYGEEYICAKAVKGSDYIRLFDENENCIAYFDGISDFSGYIIDGGAWSMQEPTREDKTEAQALYTAVMTDTLLEDYE